MIKPLIDLTINKRQADYFDEVMRAVAGLSLNRIFAYGGGVRGGKSYVSLFIFIVLAKKFPNSRWHVIRKDFPLLLSTTIPSFQKLCPEGPGVKYNRNPGNFFVEFDNGSRIYFKGENLTHDKDLNDFLGLETNGLFLEQAEELSERLFQKALQRTGSWYIDPMPPGLVLMTFNPTDYWVRGVFYDPYKANKIQTPYFFMEALPKDNPLVTDDQWNAWNQMDEISKRRFIEGDWDARRTGGEFYWAFSRARHVRQVDFKPDLPVHLSFDQNVVPYITMTCWQIEYGIDGKLHINQFDEFCLENPKNNTKDLCMEFLQQYGNKISVIYYYGDASGSKRDTRTKLTDYDIVHQCFRKYVSANSNRVNRSNPPVVKRRDFINEVLNNQHNVEIAIDSDRCRNTVQDFVNLKQDANGHKLKEKERNTDTGVMFEKWGHTSDSADYLIVKVLQSEFKRFLKGKS